MKQLIIINKENNSVSYGEKDIVHQQKILHQSFHGFIINKDRKLICRKISSENRIYPGYWSTGIGTHVIKGETTEEKIKQVFKECNCNDKPLFLGDIYVDDDFEHEISPVYVFTGEFIPKPEFPIIEYKFLTPKEIKNLNPKTTHLEKSLQLFLKKKLS